MNQIAVAQEVLSELEVIPGPSDQDRADAQRYHKAITNWFAKWFDIGLYLDEMKQRNLYRCIKGPDGKPFISFRAYTESIHNFGVRRANMLIKEAHEYKVVEEQSPEQASKLTSPSHVAALPSTLTPSEAVEVLEAAGPAPTPKTIGELAKARSQSTQPVSKPKAVARLVKVRQALDKLMDDHADLTWDEAAADELAVIINVAESLKGQCK